MRIKMAKQTPRPEIGSLPSTIAPPDHPELNYIYRINNNDLFLFCFYRQFWKGQFLTEITQDALPRLGLPFGSGFCPFTISFVYLAWTLSGRKGKDFSSKGGGG